jgi:signal transduction protein with GAF and PtsI domain
MASEQPADSLLADIEDVFAREGAGDAGMGQILSRILDSFGCAVGTIHGLDDQSGMLTIRAHHGLPEGLLHRVRVIPIGKGMAGLAAQRREPVQVCNLQTDASGVAKPGARETRMEGAISVPLLADEHRLRGERRLRGVLGIAKPVAYEFTEAEIERLMRLGSLLAGYMA